jgi:uncharacterized integral membrane protein
MAPANASDQDRRALSGGAVTSIIGAAVLLIFILQNRANVRIHFLGWYFTWPLWLYTLVVAAAGALTWFSVGVIRRHRRRAGRRAARRAEQA